MEARYSLDQPYAHLSPRDHAPRPYPRGERERSCDAMKAVDRSGERVPTALFPLPRTYQRSVFCKAGNAADKERNPDAADWSERGPAPAPIRDASERGPRARERHRNPFYLRRFHNLGGGEKIRRDRIISKRGIFSLHRPTRALTSSFFLPTTRLVAFLSVSFLKLRDEQKEQKKWGKRSKDCYLCRVT